MADSTKKTSFRPALFLNSVQMKDLPQLIDYYAKSIKATTYVCKPAVVMKYDRGTRMVDVVPLIKHQYISMEGTMKFVTEGPIHLPVKSVCCGGFSIDVPLFKGDTGWVFASDVDTTLLRQSGAKTCKVIEEDVQEETIEEDLPENPGSPMHHVYEHGFFVPDNWGTFTPAGVYSGINAVPENALYIGEAREGTATVDSNGKSEPNKKKKEGLASLSIVRGEKGNRGKVVLSVGQECVVSLDGEGKDGNGATVNLSVGGTSDIIVTKDGITINSKNGISIKSDDKISVTSTGLELPLETTFGGRGLSDIALK